MLLIRHAEKPPPEANSVHLNAEGKKRAEALPRLFEASASRPNPFGVQTTLDFTLARRSNVRLEILGVDGRRITTLVRGERDAGTYVAAWDATDRPSGVYYVVLKTPEWTRTLRLVRVR